MTTEIEAKPDTVAMVTPCCNRAMRGAPLTRSATLILSRTCGRCGQHWTVRLTPLVAGRGAEAGFYMHEASWQMMIDNAE
jgi:hypothetical protein